MNANPMKEPDRGGDVRRAIERAGDHASQPQRDRIYVVHDTRANPAQQRLVRAANKAQAIRHVAQDVFAADVAGQNALVFLLGQGVKVEDAGVSDVLREAADAAGTALTPA